MAITTPPAEKPGDRGTPSSPLIPNPQIPQMMECGAAIGKGQMEQFVKSFQQSTRRWEVVVYPALFAFVVLAGYGFFLIYSLTGDMSSMARSMDPKMGEHMESMSKSIVTLSKQIEVMSQQIQVMTYTMTNISDKLDTLPIMLQHVGKMDNSMANMVISISHMDNMMTQMDQSMTHMDKSIAQMDQSIAQMDKSIATMDESMRTMDQSMRVITATTDQMRRDLTLMSHNISNFSRPMSYANSFMPW